MAFPKSHLLPHLRFGVAGNEANLAADSRIAARPISALPLPYILIQSCGDVDVFAVDSRAARIRTFVHKTFAPPLGKNVINPLSPALGRHSYTHKSYVPYLN